VEGVPPLVFIESSLLARLLAVEWAEETTTVLIDAPNNHLVGASNQFFFADALDVGFLQDVLWDGT